MDAIEIGDILENSAIIVHSVVEHDDGTATVTMDVKPKAMKLLLELGFATLVERGLKVSELGE